jgi:hypothetical protein
MSITYIILIAIGIMCIWWFGYMWGYFARVHDEYILQQENEKLLQEWWRNQDQDDEWIEEM